MTDTRTTEQKLASLRSEKSDILRQIRRNVHRSRDDGCGRYLAKIEKQIKELENQAVDEKSYEDLRASGGIQDWN